jgi:hypothetical protein
MDPFVAWLKTTSLSQAIVLETWVWPLCETLHFIGLSLVIGVVGFFDLRLMGFMKRIPVIAVRDLMPFALAGFVLNLVTGSIFLIGLPEQYVHNRAWWMKVLFLGVAGVNAVIFERWVGSRAAMVGANEDTTAGAKVIGAVSLVAWFSVLYWGRMLPFVGNAF